MAQEAGEEKLTLVQESARVATMLAKASTADLLAAKDETITANDKRTKELLAMQAANSRMLLHQSETAQQRMLQMTGDADALTAWASM